MEYEVEGSERVHHTMKAAASNAQDAAKEYYEMHGHLPETVCELPEDEGEEQACHEVVTMCESCEKILFDGEQYYRAEDFDVCEQCAQNALASTCSEASCAP